MADKFIEELSHGDSFLHDNVYYVLSTDYRRNNDKLCFSLIDGSARWFRSSDIVNKTPLFTMDKDNNIIAIKESKKDVVNQTQNIS